MWRQKKKTFVRPKRQKEQSDEVNPGKKLCLQPPKAPIILIDDIMLDCLKCVSWKCVNKCQQINRNWFRVIKRESGLENGQSVLPPPLLEEFMMSERNKFLDMLDVSNQEMHCFERCQSARTGYKPRTFTGRKEICSHHMITQNFLLGIHVTNSREIPDDMKHANVISTKPAESLDEKHFENDAGHMIGVKNDKSEVGDEEDDVEESSITSCERFVRSFRLPKLSGDFVFTNAFHNKITDESWPHIQHWFKHLLEPYGTLKLVCLVPFDMKIWKGLTKSNPYLTTRISAEDLQINFNFHEFDWVVNFCSKFCSAKTLEWTLKAAYGDKHSRFDSDFDDSECDEDCPEECLDGIREFVASQGHNFAKFEMNARWFCSIDQQNSMATGIVQMFKSLADPSQMIKQISLKRSLNCRYAKCHRGTIEDGFPFCLDEPKSDIFKRSYKNKNSDYILETNTEYILPGSPGKSRIIHFTVIEPASQ